VVCDDVWGVFFWEGELVAVGEDVRLYALGFQWKEDFCVELVGLLQVFYEGYLFSFFIVLVLAPLLLLIPMT